MSTFYWSVDFVSTFVELYLCTIFCAAFIPEESLKMNLKKRVIICLLSAFFMYLFNQISLLSPVSFAVGITLQVLTQIAVYHKAPVKTGLLSLLFMLVLLVSDTLVGSAISYLSDIPSAEIYQEFSIYRVLLTVSSKAFLILLINVIYHSFRKANGMNTNYIIALSAISVIMFLITSILVFSEVKNRGISSVVSILFFLLMLVLLMILYFGSFRLMESQQTQQQMQLIALKNQMLEQSMKETEQTFQLWKTSLHDYKHQIATLKVMADKGDIEGICSFLEHENNLLSQKLFYYKTGNDTVDTILSLKQRVAESKGITFLINVSIPKACTVQSAHFASILGNLLDNAIEACASEANPYIEVKIGQVREQLVMTITNKCTTSPSLITSKKDKMFHGIGLYSVRQTVNSYDGEFVIEKKQDVFHAKIMIPLTNHKNQLGE